jgi:hypothetical protein
VHGVLHRRGERGHGRLSVQKIFLHVVAAGEATLFFLQN